MLGAQQRWQSKSQEGLLDFSRSISFFRTASNILLAFIGRAAWQQRHYITKVGPWDVLKGHWLTSALIFFAKDICTVNFTFVTFSYIWNHVRSVSFSDGGSRDPDIIFRDRWYLVFCFLGRVVKFQARKANSWWRSTSSNPGNWVCVLFLSFLFFCSFLLLAFFHDQTHNGSHTINGRAERRGKAERRQWK